MSWQFEWKGNGIKHYVNKIANHATKTGTICKEFCQCLMLMIH